MIDRPHEPMDSNLGEVVILQDDDEKKVFRVKFAED